MATVIKLGDGSDPLEMSGQGILHLASAGAVSSSAANYGDVTAAIAAIPPVTPADVGLPFFVDGNVPFGDVSTGLLTQDSAFKFNPSHRSVDVMNGGVSAISIRIGFDDSVNWTFGRNLGNGQLEINGTQSGANALAVGGAGGVRFRIESDDSVLIRSLSATGIVTAIASSSPNTGFGQLAIAANSAALQSVTGTNTGDQTITLTGDVTGSGTGTFGATIANDVVTFSKMQNVATDVLLGRDTAGTGDVETIAVGGGVEFTGGGAIQRSALTGDVTASAGSGTTAIAAGVVTLAKMANLSAQRLLGNDTGTGAPTALTVGPGISFSGSGGIVGDYITGVSGSATWKGSTTSGNSLTIDASFGSDGGPLLMRASRWSFDVVSPIAALTASTEQVAWDHKARSVTFGTGALTTQRETVFRAPTYAFSGASMMTKATTVSITGAPAAGANATITTPLALDVEAGNVRMAGKAAVGTTPGSFAFEVIGMTRLGGRTGVNQDPNNTSGVYFETQITGSTDRVIWNIGGSATALPNGTGATVYVDWTTNTTSIATGATVAGLFTHRFKRQTFDASSATITDEAPATVTIEGPPHFTGGMTVPASRRALRVELGDVALDAGDLFVNGNIASVGSVNCGSTGGSAGTGQIFCGDLALSDKGGSAVGVIQKDGGFLRIIADPSFGASFRSNVTEMIGYNATQVGIFGSKTTQFTYGTATAGGTYGAVEQTMLQRLWDMLRAGTGGFGLNT